MRPLSIDRRSFERIAGHVSRASGITLPASKMPLVEARLQRRLRALGLESFQDYANLLEHAYLGRDEVARAVELMTTHTTGFFREPAQFEILDSFAADTPARHRLRVWSAACSTGMEPFTIAMVLAHLVDERRLHGFQVWGTDVSRRVLQVASQATYSRQDAQDVPEPYRHRYLLAAGDPGAPKVRVIPSLRRGVRFGQLNLTVPPYAVPRELDAVFCRNVLIYFEPELQRRVVASLLHHLRPGGLLFLGHAETAAAQGQGLKLVGHGVFQSPPAQELAA